MMKPEKIFSVEHDQTVIAVNIQLGRVGEKLKWVEFVLPEPIKLMGHQLYILSSPPDVDGGSLKSVVISEKR